MIPRRRTPARDAMTTAVCAVPTVPDLWFHLHLTTARCAPATAGRFRGLRLQECVRRAGRRNVFNRTEVDKRRERTPLPMPIVVTHTPRKVVGLIRPAVVVMVAVALHPRIAVVAKSK